MNTNELALKLAKIAVSGTSDYMLAKELGERLKTQIRRNAEISPPIYSEQYIEDAKLAFSVLERMKRYW